MPVCWPAIARFPRSAAARIRRFAWSATTEQLVPLLAGYPYSDGIAINNNNEVAGAYTYMARRAYVNTSAGTLDLGTLGGNSYARGINDDTEVVGYSEPPGFVSTDPNWDIGHAFYWDQNLGMVDLNDLIYRPTPQSLANLYDFRKASAINRHHQIVGMAALPALNVIRAFRLDRQPDPTQRWPCSVYAFNELGTLPNGGISYGLALNSGGTVVGTAYRRCERPWQHPGRIVRDGCVFNLNDGLSPLDLAEWTLLQATGINDNGEMVGWGQKTVEGQLHAFKLNAARLHRRECEDAVRRQQRAWRQRKRLHAIRRSSGRGAQRRHRRSAGAKRDRGCKRRIVLLERAECPV